MLGIAITLLVLWALAVLVFKVAAGAIHLVLLVAAIALLAHFVRGRVPR